MPFADLARFARAFAFAARILATTLLLLAALGSCSSSPTTTEREAEEATGAAAPARRGTHTELTPALRAAWIRSVQRDASAEHRLTPTTEYPVTVDPLIAIEQQKLTPDGVGSNDYFGFSVAVSGDTAVVGAYLATQDLPRQGVVYVFVRSGTTWTEQQKLTASDAAYQAQFGHSVAVSGDVVVVGSYNEVDAGAAYVFVRSGTTWTEQQKLTASDVPGDPFFAHSVAVSGDTAIVGTHLAGGAAYVFVRSGTTWTQQQKLTAADAAPHGYFGWSVAVSGDTALVGDFVDPTEFGGAAYVFVRSGTTWTQQQKLNASDMRPNQEFGHAVALSGDTAVVGAPQPTVSDGGAAYVFVRSGTTWTQQQKLTANDVGANSRFGHAVAVSGDAAVVGVPTHANQEGAAYVFVRSGTTWTELETLTRSDVAAFDQFGQSVAASGDTVIVGADWKRAAYVFTVQRANGDPCAVGTECASGFCVDGVCCDTACNAGACDACSVASGATVDGTCTLLTGTACDDGDACTQTDTCAAGVCVGANPNTCSGQGTCGVGTCTCNVGYVGESCEFGDATTCNGHGAAQSDGSCVCAAAFAGTSCDACAPDHYGYPTCAFCTAAGTCNGHGSCAADGACACAPGFAGPTCSACLPDHYGPSCTRCIASECPAAPDDCHEAATCSANGECVNAAKPDGAPCATGTCRAGVCTTSEAGPTADPGSPADAGSSSNGGSSGGEASNGQSDGGSSGGAASPGASDQSEGGGCAVVRPSSSTRGGLGSLVFFSAVGVLTRRRRTRAGRPA